MDERLYNPAANSAAGIVDEDWYQNADAIFKARMADYQSYGQPGGYASYVQEARKYQSNMDPLETMGYLNTQRAIDSNWEYAQNLGKSIYNGGIGVVRDTLNGIRAARDYNIAMLNERAKAEGFERNTNQDFVNALDNAAKAQVLQPFEVKQSASAAGQFGLDLAQGAGQLVGQMAVSIPAEAVAPGIGGLTMMVGQITGGQYEDLKAKGVDTKRAAEAAFANAMIQAPFERLSLTRLMQKVPTGSVLKKKLKMVLEDMFTEGVTEAIQQFPEEWAEMWALNPDKSWKELQAMAAKKFPDTLQNALYAGLIGGVLGAGSRGIHIALDRNIDMALRKELHDETIGAIENRINRIKQSGISPDYAGETVNANLNNATVLIDGGTLNAYAQRVGEEKAAKKLGVTVEEIREAAEKGDTVEVKQGNFEALSASDPSFYQEVRDDLSFDANDMSNRKYDTIQANVERYSKMGEKQRTELKTEVDKIAKSMEEAGVPKGQIEGMKAMLSSFATAMRPDNPAQFIRDNALRFERGVTRLADTSINLNEERSNLVKDILDTNFDNPREEVENRLNAIEEEIEKAPEASQTLQMLKAHRDMLASLLNSNDAGIPAIENYRQRYNRDNGTFQGGGSNTLFQVPVAEFNRQKAEVRAQYEGTDQWMKAPDGSDTNLTENQWITVRTPAFKNWFGDWENNPANASKVLDENGEPLVVYHGSDADFDTFDRTKSRANMDIQGNFFSPWKEDAEGYGSNVRAFFLNIKNPANEGQGYKALNKFKGQNGAGIKAREDLTSQGFDGVNNENEEYIAFEPNQIKDATGRNVGFDPESGNIYLQSAWHGTGARFDRFSTDFMGTGEGAQVHGWGLYFAKDREIAEGYRNQMVYDEIQYRLSKLDPRSKEYSIMQQVLEFASETLLGTDPDTVIADAEEDGGYDPEAIKRFKENKIGQVFEADVPENDVMLDEQKTLAEREKAGENISKLREALEEMVSDDEDGQLWDYSLGDNVEDENGNPETHLYISNIADENLTGEEIYNTIVQALKESYGLESSEAAKQASLLLNKYGIKGIAYDGEVDGRCFVVFDDKAIDILNKYYQRQQEALQVKGSFDPFTDGEAVIKLFEGADASTVIHETGHYYIESMWREIAAGRATKQQQEDFEKLMKYCGITTAQWAKMDTEGRRAAHERLAEAIETYVMEDKAPTRELRPVFKRFAKWLKAVYAAISRNRNAVPLTDEVREVFDRMLASEEDVEQMRRVEGYFEKLPSVITDNLSDATKKRIEDYILNAQDKAVEILTKERLANFSEDRKREIENYRNMISDDVRQEVASRPLYVAARQAQELLGGEKPASAKQYANLYLEEKLSDENEVKWEIVAEQNNMSPMELAQKLLEEPSENEAYEAAMKEAVQKEFPDYYTERAQAEEATREAMYNDESGILLGVEQTLIEDFAARAAAQQRSAETSRKLAMAKRQQAKVAAQKELARMKVKDATRVDRFIAAERRCAVKAAEAMAKKDYETARQYKDMQAFNHACVIESANMRKRIEQYQKFLKKQFRSKREAWTSEQHFNQAAALFARMGLVRKDYDPDTRTQSLLEYLNEMGEMLYPFNEIPDWLASDSWPLNRPTEMSFDDYEKVIDLIRYIRTMAKIEKAANFFDSSSNYQEWKEQAIENLNKLATKFVPVLGKRQVASWKDKFKAAYQTLDNFLEKMDGWEFGFFSRSFGDAIKHCNDNEFVHLEAYQKRKAEIENAWCPTQEALEAAAKEVYYEELGVAANKFVLTKILMNLGNESNARKLCSSYPSEALRNSSLWVFENGMMTKDEAIAQTKENLLEFLGRVLTKEDIAYAQGKIDLAGMYWGEMAELDRRTRGFTPKKIEAYPVTIRLSNGEEIVFRGGYFPLIRNGEMGSHPAGILPVSETDAKQGKNVRTMYTDTGHMKARVEAEYPVDLTEGSEDRAMQKAIHDLCWRETMTDFRRILNDQFMFGLMKTKLGIADMTSFREMLEHAAQPEGSASMAMGEGLLAQTAGWLRRKTVNSIVMLNLRINLQNFGNIFLYGNSVDGFGYSDVIAAMGNAFSRGFDGRNFSEMWNFVDEKSAFMRSRSETPDITLADLREEGKLNKFERAAMEWGAKAMMYTDGLTARPVWVQAYTKKLNEGATEQEAIDFADTIIRRTLGSGRATDVSSLQRGGPVYKLFTAFQGFFNTQFNQWVREYNIDKRLLSEGNTGEAIQRITAFVASKYLAACLFNLVLALEKPFDDDDDKYMNYTKELLHYPMSLVGIYGPVANFAMDKALGIKAYSYRMSIIESSLDKVYRASGKMGKMIDGDFEAGLEGLTDVVGIAAGVPAQMNRLFWNAYDIFVNGMDPRLEDLATRRPKRERK